jgi:hypothetical protein
MRSTQKKRSMGRSEAGTILRPEDRLKAQPQEHQHRAAKRDAGPTAPGRGFNVGLYPGGASGSLLREGS